MIEHLNLCELLELLLLLDSRVCREEESLHNLNEYYLLWWLMMIEPLWRKRYQSTFGHYSQKSLNSSRRVLLLTSEVRMIHLNLLLGQIFTLKCVIITWKITKFLEMLIERLLLHVVLWWWNLMSDTHCLKYEIELVNPPTNSFFLTFHGEPPNRDNKLNTISMKALRLKNICCRLVNFRAG